MIGFQLQFRFPDLWATGLRLPAAALAPTVVVPTPAQPDEGTRWVQSSLNVLMGAGLNVDGISGPDDPTALSVRIADFFPITWSNTARGGICYIAVTILALSS
jgi:hypothetical protein